MKKLLFIILCFASMTSFAQIPEHALPPKITWQHFPTLIGQDTLFLAYAFEHFENFPKPVKICIRVQDSAQVTDCELYHFDFDSIPRSFGAHLYGIMLSAYGKLYVQCVISDVHKNVLYTSDKQLLIHYTKDEKRKLAITQKTD